VKQLIVFDLDGTLAESKSPLDSEMAALLHDLLGILQVAVISGGDWPQFEKQLLSNLPQDDRLVSLWDKILPIHGRLEKDLFRRLHPGRKRENHHRSHTSARSGGFQGRKALGSSN